MRGSNEPDQDRRQQFAHSPTSGGDHCPHRRDGLSAPLDGAIKQAPNELPFSGPVLSEYRWLSCPDYAALSASITTDSARCSLAADTIHCCHDLCLGCP